MTEQIVSCLAQAWDVPACNFRSPDDDGGLVGIEITDLGGTLPSPMVAVFAICATQGTKGFMSARYARDLADQLIAAADQLEAGATVLGGN